MKRNTTIDSEVPVKRIDIKEFRKMGLLHELNRQFLHPIGLALEILVELDGSENIGGIWDYRNDPEGMLFNEIDKDKMNKALAFIGDKHSERMNTLGFIVQTDNVEVSNE